MDYCKLIAYGETAELYRYEKRPVGAGVRDRGRMARTLALPHVSDVREDDVEASKPPKSRRADSVKRAADAFRRLVGANLSEREAPVLLTLTYRENMGNIAVARRDFNAFSKRLSRQLGSGIRWITTLEYQARGAVHFHAFVWGVEPSVVAGERSTRLFATLWGKGFVDLKQTDGNIALAGYLTKYMSKTFADPRAFGRKAYIASRNVLKPIVIRDVVLSPFMMGEAYPDLSTGVVIRSREYMTQWLGRCLYQRYKIKPTYGSS